MATDMPMEMTSHPAYRREEGGFTLLEAMVALAILGGAMFLLLGAHYGALKLYEESREQARFFDLMTLATGIARSDVAAGKTSGGKDFNKRWPDCSWSYKTTPMAEDSPGLTEVSVTVKTPDYEREMVFYVFSSKPLAQ